MKKWKGIDKRFCLRWIFNLTYLGIVTSLLINNQWSNVNSNVYLLWVYQAKWIFDLVLWVFGILCFNYLFELPSKYNIRIQITYIRYSSFKQRNNFTTFSVCVTGKGFLGINKYIMKVKNDYIWLLHKVCYFHSISYNIRLQLHISTLWNS